MVSDEDAYIKWRKTQRRFTRRLAGIALDSKTLLKLLEQNPHSEFPLTEEEKRTIIYALRIVNQLTEKLRPWLATLVRHARCWTEELLERDPETVNAMFKESPEESVERARVLLRQELGPDPADVDDASAAKALMEWANRGLESSENRVGLWQLVVEVVDAALWVGWLFPRTSQ